MPSIRARATTTVRGIVTSGLIVGLITGVSACSVVGSGDDGAEPADRVVLVTHESFNLPDELVARFEDETGLELTVRPAGDAGTLTNKLVLTRDNPTGDVAFGVDNAFASRAVAEGVFAPYAAELPEGAEAFALPGDPGEGAGLLTPVDTGNVCVNVDDTWFAERGQQPPATLEDLRKPAYRDLLVVPGAATSSPGMAFLLATIAEYGDRWPDYWADLMANGAKLTDGWSDAYQAEFTQGGGPGTRPIVVSYDSSPAFTLDEEGGTTTSALLDTCLRQVEYAGVLAGADNPDGAEQLVDFLLSDDVQAALPESMYVFPVSSAVELPEDWARFARQPEAPYELDPAEVDANRDAWLREWSDVTSR
ncbi:thiamine ABC transporter substrate-binding protein [Nocardioides pantholopis]|uniref:thiamine ABC transporter substrate-binding protein n=1 Tax=Nocardioides pantholopis TaxID=2483798 RepID=UPI000F07C2F5|nr:thiamine ABC transporter substrate-binding protein [Nocardioides pantholopis]